MAHDDLSELLRFRRPKLRLGGASIPRLLPESKLCIQNLAAYRAPPPLFNFPRKRISAVLVALFVGRGGDLYVLLSQRASTLRTYAGDTVLPGGRWEPGDETLEDTARREAFEEIGLPIDKDKVPLLCVLEPFLAGTHVIVFPVVVLILDTTGQPLINQAEVASLFSHPLRGFLTTDTPSTSTTRYFIPPFNDPFLSTHLHAPEDNSPLQPTSDFTEADSSEPPKRISLSFVSSFYSPSPTDAYYAYTDIPWSGSAERRVRMHRFLTGREAGGTRPIYGLTASVLIRTACIGYAQAPLFALEAPHEPSVNERFARVFLTNERFREEAHAEGIDPDAVVRRVQDQVDKERRQRVKSMSKQATRTSSNRMAKSKL